MVRGSRRGWWCCGCGEVVGGANKQTNQKDPVACEKKEELAGCRSGAPVKVMHMRRSSVRQRRTRPTRGMLGPGAANHQGANVPLAPSGPTDSHWF